MDAHGGSGPAVHVYNLGKVDLPDAGPRGPLPVRIWGAIGVPAGPGPHPLVVVAHGRHGDGCPIDDQDFPTWPCFASEQRNDLGLRHVVRALAERGFVAIAPDLNGAFTAGWGEPNDRARWPRVVNRTLRPLAADATDGGTRFGTEMAGKLDLTRIGVLGHSLSGFNAARFARFRADNTSAAEVASGRGPLSAAFLLAPVAGSGSLPDIEAAVVLASCDGDTGDAGRRYLLRARRTPGRSEPLHLPRLIGANHNYFNRTLARLEQDDAMGLGARCRPGRRLSGRQQQHWLGRAATGFFRTVLSGAPRPRWLRLHGRPPVRAYGRRVEISRFVP